MVVAFVTFLLVTASYIALTVFALYRVASHLRGNPEGTRAVVEHVFLPLFGKKTEEPEPEFETEPDGKVWDAELLDKQDEVFKP